jgi:hydroxypyruvate isomerase
MEIPRSLSRRQAMKLAASAAAALRCARPAAAAPPLKGRLKQSAARWCYGKIPLEDLAKAAAEMGLRGLDLVQDPKDWPTLKKHGLVSSMVTGAGTIPDGLNRKENHDRLEREMRENIARAAEAGLPNVITFSGNRRGLSDQEGLENCVIGLNRVKGVAEERNVTICLELLNSKVNHTDYQFDHMPWGVEVIKRVNSPRVKILYDIYHAQVMAGDLVATIRENIQWIGHFHTAGVPGRLDINDTQEINYRFVAQSIADLGFTGYISHEFRPAPGHNPLDCIREAYAIIDV